MFVKLIINLLILYLIYKGAIFVWEFYVSEKRFGEKQDDGFLKIDKSKIEDISFEEVDKEKNKDAIL